MHAAIYTHANFFALMVSVNLEVAVCAWSKHGDGQMDEVSVTRKPFPLWTVCTHAYMGIWLWVEHDKNMTLLPRLVSPAFLLCDELQLGSRRFCIHVFSLFLRRPRRSRATVAYIFFVFGRQICSWKKKSNVRYFVCLIHSKRKYYGRSRKKKPNSNLWSALYGMCVVVICALFSILLEMCIIFFKTKSYSIK